MALKILKYPLFRGWLLFILLQSTVLFTQTQSPYFDLVSVKKGLSCSAVFSIAQDSAGFLWFGTEDGLNRFDGYTCRVYRHIPEDTASLSENAVTKLLFANGRLWVVTRSGHLNYYQASTETFRHISLPEERSPVAALTSDARGTLFAATARGGLYRFDPQSQRFFLFSDTLATYFKKHDFRLFCLHADKLGYFWLGTWQGLVRFDPVNGQFIYYHSEKLTPQAPAGNMIMDIAEDSAGNVWFATHNGLSCWQEKQQRFVHFRHQLHQTNCLSSNRVLSLLVDSSSGLWIGTLDKGVCRLSPDQRRLTCFRHNPVQAHSLANGAVFDLFQDREGGVWIATYGGGVSYYHPQSPRFGYFTHDPTDKNSLSHNLVLSLLKDRNGSLWVGTDGGGLNMLRSGESHFRHYLQYAGPLATNSITALYETRDGTVWLGTDVGQQTPGGKILRYNRQKDRFEPFSPVRLKFGGVSVFLQDHTGALWIGTFAEGLYRYDMASGAVRHFRYQSDSTNGLSGNSVTCLLEDSNDYLWIGTINRGLNRYDPRKDRFTHYNYQPDHPSSLAGNTVWSAAQDDRNGLWFGTNGGLSYYDTSQNCFRNFTAQEGLPGNMIFSILPDTLGNLWLGTGRGLVCFNSTNYSIKIYDTGDGLLNTEFVQGACFKDQNETFYFGGNHGVTFFNPVNISKSKTEPPVVLIDFRVKGKTFRLPKSLHYTSTIQLNYRQNFFSFTFAALDYKAPQKIRYAYQLQGVDSGWVACGNRRFADYTDVAPGNYTFEVKATNSDGVWSPHRASVNIVITPPFWETWWFRLLLMLLVVAFLFVLHRYRVNKLLAVERTRLRIARDLHDDVSATITGIAYFTEALEHQVNETNKQAVNKLFGLIRESIQNVQDSMSDIIWAIKPENDRWDTFFPKLRRFASELCESKDIGYHIMMPEPVPSQNLDMERRRNLWLVFKEIVTNSVKHAHCTRLTIDLQTDKTHLIMNIADNGKGFDPAKIKEGNGIKNIYRRCEQLTARVVLRTAPGQGTHWQIHIPL